LTLGPKGIIDSSQQLPSASGAEPFRSHHSILISGVFDWLSG